jgi:hypothetical protein
MSKLHVIYIPGLHDQAPMNRGLAKIFPPFWRSRGFNFHIVRLNWEKGKRFAPKMKLILDKIDELSKDGDKVFLIGQSAGGSAALNAFIQRRGVVKGVINSTGRLRKGEGFKPDLDLASITSPAFKESVILFERKEPSLTASDRKKIMTVRTMWDQLVPASTVSIKGAKNLTAPIAEHMTGGTFIMSVYSRVLQNFFRDLV